MTQEDDVPSIAEITRLLQEMIDEGTVEIRTKSQDDPLKDTYKISDFGHWLIETDVIISFASGDRSTKDKIRRQYEEQK